MDVILEYFSYSFGRGKNYLKENKKGEDFKTKEATTENCWTHRDCSVNIKYAWHKNNSHSHTELKIKSFPSNVPLFFPNI